MSDDDYLWDGSGAPDPDVVRLERALAPLRLRAREFAPARARRRRFLVPALLAAAACVAAAWLLRGTEGAPAGPVATPLAVELDGTALGGGRDTWVVADDTPRELALGDVGRVTLRAGTRLQVRSADTDGARLYLARGTIDAQVDADARPRFFQVETRAALCVDLGCAYTLSVDDDGAARVEVTSGKVAFEGASREVFVPAHAVCRARSGLGPGTPRFADAPAALAAAFDAYDDAWRGDVTGRRSAARAALAAVEGGRDTLPAWHLLQDPDAEIARAAEACLVRVAGRPWGAGDELVSASADGRARWRAHLELVAW